MAVASGETNLRSGPGTDFSVAGSLAANQSAEIVGKNQAGTWWQIKTADGKNCLDDCRPGHYERAARRSRGDSHADACRATQTRPPGPGGRFRVRGRLANRQSEIWNFSAIARAGGRRLVLREAELRLPSSRRQLRRLPGATAIRLNGQPTGITAWVYGDGKGHYLNAWVDDNAGERRAYSFGQVSHTGWQQMTAWLDNSAAGPTATSAAATTAGWTTRPILLRWCSTVCRTDRPAAV